MKESCTDKGAQVPLRVPAEGLEDGWVLLLQREENSRQANGTAFAKVLGSIENLRNKGCKRTVWLELDQGTVAGDVAGAVPAGQQPSPASSSHLAAHVPTHSS